jgi:hypothetical protein
MYNSEDLFLGLGKKAQARKTEKADATAYKKKTESDAKLISAQAELEMAKAMSIPSAPAPALMRSAAPGSAQAPEKNFLKDNLTTIYIVAGILILAVGAYFMLFNNKK